MSGKTDLAAAVAARLLNRARETGDDYQALLTSYCLERVLYRLAVSDRRDRFVLKRALLRRLWSEQPCRATLPARCGKARLGLQIDMGLADAVWPAPQPCVYPPLLDFPGPELLPYPPEAMVAEKLEAMVVLGDRNSRIKDFFDVHHPASRFEFDRATLAEAVRRTFERRGTPIPDHPPIALTRAYWDTPSRPTQVRAFARRARIAVPADFADECARTLDAFLSPALGDLRSGRATVGTWPPGGPWQ